MSNSQSTSNKNTIDLTPPRVGAKLQRLRNDRKLTLEDLSRLAGVSKSVLSEIERNRANPTIAVMWRLTNALGVSLDALFATSSESNPILINRAHDSPVLSNEDCGYTLRVWGPVQLAGSFEWYELTLEPGGSLSSQPHEPGTQEHLTVFNGSMTITVEGHQSIANSGETARYFADKPHSITNPGMKLATALLVVVHS